MHIGADSLTDFISDIFIHAGCSADESRRIGQNLVDANLTGHDSHGVIRTPRYVKWLESGNLVAGQTADTVLDSGSMIILDGKFGFGQTVGPQAVEAGIERAKSEGISVVALRHAGHLGRIGAFAERAAAAGLVSLHFVNVCGSVLVAPFGGADRRLGTNPVAIGMPAGDGRPMILDFATSYVAEGKVLVAAKGGKALPGDCLIGADGVPSNDPTLLYGDQDPTTAPEKRDGPGAIRTFGEHKGSGLALACELLAGALTRSGCTGFDRPRVYNGMLSIYLSVDSMDSDGGYARDVGDYLDFFTSAAPAGDEPVLTPGEPERKSRAERLAGGVPLADDTWAAIVQIGQECGAAAPIV